jgi:acetyl-CoA carboxylase biotin carboxyl carrier protein
MVNWELIDKLIQKVKDAEISGLAVEEGGVKYEVQRQVGGVPQVSVGGHSVVVPSGAQEKEQGKEKEEEGTIAITSPMVGTFYRSPSPESPPFVEVGDEVESGKVVCIIEAMKLFNEIESEVRGKVAKVLVENGQPVEYGQKLILIKKS